MAFNHSVLRLAVPMFDADPRIYDPAALPWRQREDRVQVELSDLRNFFDEARESQQHLFEGLHIRCRVAPVAFQQSVALNLSNHLSCVAIGEGGNSKPHIAEDFHVNASYPKRDQR